MRIDTHTHCEHADKDPQGHWLLPTRSAWFDGVETPEEYIAALRRNGIKRVAVIDEARIIFPMKELFGDFVIPIPMVDMNRITPEEIDSLFKQGAAAIKFIAPLKSYGDDAYMPLYDVVNAHHSLAVFHTGYLATGLYDPGCIKDIGAFLNVENMRPMAIDRIVRKFPDLKIQMAHMGNPWWEEAWCMLYSHKNVYADFSGRPPHRSLDMWADLFAPDGKLSVKTVSKLCFGSDAQTLWPGMHDTARNYVQFYDSFYERLVLPQELRDRIDSGNFLDLIRDTVK